MEYFLGSIVTLVTLFLSAWIFRKSLLNKSDPLPYSSQARSFAQIAPFIAYTIGTLHPEAQNTQAVNYIKSKSVKVVFFESRAYWIQNNIFYTASAPNNIVDHESTKVVDTLTMDKVQLEKISMIVDKLTEGNADDSGNSRNKKFY